MKMKNFCKPKDTVNKTKQKPIYWEKILTNPTLNGELVSKIYKEPWKLGTQKSILKWGKELNREFSTEDSQKVEKHLNVLSLWSSVK